MPPALKYSSSWFVSILDKSFIFKKLPICPPSKTKMNKGQYFKNSSKTIFLGTYNMLEIAKNKSKMKNLTNVEYIHGYA